MAPDQRQIYATEAESYDQLVAAEDWRGNLLPAITAIAAPADADIVEFGAGTGRLTRLLAPVATSIHALDQSPQMLRVARQHLMQLPGRNWTLTVADNRAMPLPSRCADVAIAGWCFGHSTVWQAADWRAEIARALEEMLRLLRPGGRAIILETLGTGVDRPRAPSPELADYYHWLEAGRGFRRRWLRSDYRFASLHEAGALLDFFFGAELAQQVRRSGSCILPECTGIWWRQI